MVTCAPTCIVDVVVTHCTWSFRTKKECQVKSSQVQISMAAAPAAFGAPAGAIDREGAARRNWHGWKAPSRGFIVYPHRLHVFFLIIAGAPQVTIFVPFSGSFPPLKGQLSSGRKLTRSVPREGR